MSRTPKPLSHPDCAPLGPLWSSRKRSAHVILRGVNLVEVGVHEPIVDVAARRIARVTVRKRVFLGSFAGGRPLALPAQPFTALGAQSSGVVRAHHHRRMRPGNTRVLVAIDAKTLATFRHLASASLREFVADHEVIGAIQARVEARLLRLRAVQGIDVLHLGRTRRDRLGLRRRLDRNARGDRSRSHPRNARKNRRRTRNARRGASAWRVRSWRMVGRRGSARTEQHEPETARHARGVKAGVLGGKPS